MYTLVHLAVRKNAHSGRAFVTGRTRKCLQPYILLFASWRTQNTKTRLESGSGDATAARPPLTLCGGFEACKKHPHGAVFSIT